MAGTNVAAPTTEAQPEELGWQPTFLDHAHDGVTPRESYKRVNLIGGLAWGISSLALVKLVIWGTVEVAKSSDPIGLLRAVENSDTAPWPWLGFLAALIGFIPLAILLPILIHRYHRRSWRLSVTPYTTIDVGQMAKGAALWAVLYAAVAAATALALRDSITVEFEFGEFVPGLVVLLALTPVQAFGQELFFRGYNLQFAALDVRSHRALAVISGLAFGVPFLFSPWIVHWIVPEIQVPDIPLVERAILMLGYVLLGAALALVSLRTGTIELAIGIAFANNLLTALLLSPHAGSMAGGSLVDIDAGIMPSLAHVALLAAGLWVLVRLSSRFVPARRGRALADAHGHAVAGSPVTLPTGSPMFRLAVRELAAHKLRLALTVLAIALGVSFVVGTLVFADTTNNALKRFFESEPADVVVKPSDGVTVFGQGGPPPDLTMPAALADDVERVAGVAEAIPSVEQEGVLILDDAGEPVGGATSAHVGASYEIGQETRSDSGAAGGFEGEPPVGAGQVALDTGTADRMGAEVGDVIHLATPLRTDREMPWRVTGIFDLGLNGGVTVALFDLPTAQQYVTGPGRVNQLLVTVAEGANSAQVARDITDELGESAGIEAITGREAADRSASQVAESLGFLNTLMVVFAFVAVLMSTFLIFNTFAMLVAQRTRELALVRAVGAGQDQIQTSVLIQAAALGIVGTILGVAFGIALSFALRWLLAAFRIDIPTGSLVIEPGMLLIACIVGIGVTLLAAWAPALRAARIPPVQALQIDPSPQRGDAQRRMALGGVLAGLAACAAVVGFRDSIPDNAVAWMGLSALIAIGAFVTLAPAFAGGMLRVLGLPLRSVVGQLAARNSRRNRRRTTATAAALTIGVALMSMIAVLTTSTTATADAEIEKAIGADLSIGAPPLYRPFDHAFTTEAAAVPGVADSTYIRVTNGQRNDLPLPVFGVEPAKIGDAVNLNVTAGELTDIGGDRIAVDSQVAQRFLLEPGDTFEAQFRTGPAEFEVVAVFDPIIVYTGLMTDLATAERLGATPGQDTAAYFTLAPGADATAVRDSMSEVISRNPALQLQDTSVMKDDFRAGINRLLGFVYAMLALAVLIGVLSIVNTLMLSVHERSTEIGLLRAVGATRSQIRSMVVAEAALVGLFGAVSGVLLGLAYGVFLQVVMQPLGIKELDIPWLMLLAFMVAGALAGVLAALLPARIASRANILQSIAE